MKDGETQRKSFTVGIMCAHLSCCVVTSVPELVYVCVRVSVCVCVCV